MERIRRFFRGKEEEDEEKEEAAEVTPKTEPVESPFKPEPTTESEEATIADSEKEVGENKSWSE
jgi:hypothetical protein